MIDTTRQACLHDAIAIIGAIRMYSKTTVSAASPVNWGAVACRTPSYWDCAVYSSYSLKPLMAWRKAAALEVLLFIVLRTEGALPPPVCQYINKLITIFNANQGKSLSTIHVLYI